MKDTPDTGKAATYPDLHLDQKNQLRTKLYSKKKKISVNVSFL